MVHRYVNKKEFEYLGRKVHTEKEIFGGLVINYHISISWLTGSQTTSL